MNKIEDVRGQIPQRPPLMSKITFKIIDYLQMALVLVLTFIVFNTFFRASVVPSLSMYPTLQVNELLVTRKNVLPTYDDIIVFHPYSEKTAILCAQTGTTKDSIFVKRVVGLPGDVIEVKNGHLYRNGTVVVAEYTAEQVMSYEMPPVTVGKQEYFVMGDNRNVSQDSHIFGTFAEEQLLGVVVFHVKFPWDMSHLRDE